MCKPTGREQIEQRKPLGSRLGAREWGPAIGIIIAGLDLTEDFHWWKWSAVSFCFSEAFRVGAQAALPWLWAKLERGAGPDDDTVDSFGLQTLSLVISVFTLHQLSLFQGYLSWETPFIHATNEDKKNWELFAGMAVVLMGYIANDTLHMLQKWRTTKNYRMLVHHFIFMYVCWTGVYFHQEPRHYSTHAILFAAEISTPFLNLRWILRFIFDSRKSEAVLLPVFAVLFTLTRVVLYFFLVLDLWTDRETLGMGFLNYVFPIAVGVSFIINCLWWKQIVEGVLRKMNKPRKVKSN